MEKSMMDPDKIQRDKKYGPHFSVEVTFRRVCKTCQSSMMPHQLCSFCNICMQGTDLQFWEIIKRVLDVRVAILTR